MSHPTSRHWQHLPIALIVAASLTLALLALVSWAAPARASTFVVTKTEDTADGVCDADCSLREAIMAANADPDPNIITVPAGVYTLTLDIADNYACQHSPQYGPLKVTGDVTINGAGRDLTILDGSGLPHCGGVLEIGEYTKIVARLTDLTVRHDTGGWYARGIGANNADLSLISSTVTSNTGGIYFDTYGVVGNLVLQASTVAANAGRGIRATGVVTLTNSSVISNTDGGIHIGGGSLALQASTVAWNSAGGRGGGIEVGSANAVVSDSVILSNTAGLAGGGIHWYEYSTDPHALTIISSTIAGNTAGDGGGGVVASGDSLIMRDSTVSGNTAGNNSNGGGIQAYVTSARISNTVISHNTATGFSGGGLSFGSASWNLERGIAIVGSAIEYNTVRQTGGGLYASSGTAVDIQDSSISHNTAGPESQTSGGGVSVDSDGALTLTRVTIAGNQALGSGPSGGGIRSASGLMLVDSMIRDNVVRKTDSEGGCGSPAGGGIVIAAPLVVTGTTFSNNRTVNHASACGQATGGALSVGGPYTITNSTFISNTAEAGGGLAAVSDGSYQNTLRNTVFISNTAAPGVGGSLYRIADGSGGGLYDGSAGLHTAISVIFQGNTAARDGGGAYANLALIGGRVENNTAGGNGGGLYGPTQVFSSTVTGNQAANGGGISSAGTVEIVASTISANRAITDGGGIYVPFAGRGGPIVTVRNSTLSGNSAARGGAFNDVGGLSISGRFTSKAHFVNTTIVSNTAISQTGGIYHAWYIGYDEYGQADPQELTLENTLLSNARGNCATPADDPTFISYGHNLSSDNKCLGLTGPGDLTSVVVRVGPLQDNGGPTLTHADRKSTRLNSSHT